MCRECLEPFSAEDAAFPEDDEAGRLEGERTTTVTHLAAGAAHEIRNPLSRIMASLEAADAVLGSRPAFAGERGKEDVAEVRRCLDEALEAGKRIRRLVESLHALAGVRCSTTKAFDVHDSLERALDLTAPLWRERARVARSYGEVPQVDGHFGRLTQAFIDILTNAAEAIPRGAPGANAVTIETRLDEAGRAVIEISDSGAGIDPADLPHVFEPFFTTKPRAVSTGLGLSLARKAVQASGGEIHIESERGRGTRVVISLPIVSFASATGAPARQSSPSGTRRAAGTL